jgi:hypothetical protein
VGIRVFWADWPALHQCLARGQCACAVSGWSLSSVHAVQRGNVPRFCVYPLELPALCAVYRLTGRASSGAQRAGWRFQAVSGAGMRGAAQRGGGARCDFRVAILYELRSCRRASLSTTSHWAIAATPSETGTWLVYSLNNGLD